ncbi:hypothetical protein HMPREF9711_01114 [Myroides odoratimimus CCUG 3837]|uniref:hypothetical protein n=1 Tax=Myroides odoratimimus TaxID=76832 RepID=UPI000280A627|nr:hypothetical protein [Myroides odoratimimus]EKB05548.1 hypothetical protein HMPREF9711_01114 [Myroides odoratimimus CCUG 3837]
MFEKQNNRSLKELLSYLLLCCAFLALTGSVYGQGIERTKTERKIVRPQKPFNKIMPNLRQGDFAVIGNTNQYYTNYNPALDNTQSMRFVDIDNDPTTVNSSMAELKIPGGANTKIVYAGLYWIGTIPKGLEEVDVTVDNKTWKLNKRKVKLKHAKNSQYYDLVDVESDYNYSGRVYTSKVDITDIIQENGEGDYYVANVASDLKDNEEKITGWGMVVVYSNESMSWRSINLIEHMGYYSSGEGKSIATTVYAINKGDIHLNIGYIVGGATKVYDNDYLIFKNENNEQFKLSHSGNSEDNFFNGSIYLTDSKRLPKYVDNAGMDIGMMEVPNPNNTVIKNGDGIYSIMPSVKHRQEHFYMPALLSSVETFVVDVLPENFIQSGVVDNGTVGPGQEMVWDLTIRNVSGQEEARGGKIEIPIPPSLHYISSSIDQTMDVTGTVTWTPPVGATSTDSSKVPGGTLVWTFGKKVPIADINKILGKLTYKLKVVDCTILSTTVNNLMSGFDLNGTLRVLGQNGFDDEMKSPLVKTPGTLENRNFEDFSATFSIPECPDIVNGVKIYEEFCTLPANVIARAKILGDYPPGTKFYSVVPGTANYEQSEITGDFAANETGIMYYAIAPGFGENHYMKLSAAYKGLTSTPTVQNEEFCISQPVILHNQPSQAGLKLYYFDSATATTPLANPPAPTTAGVHTYYVAEGELIDGTYCLGPKKAFTLTGTYCTFKSRINPNFSIEKK